MMDISKNAKLNLFGEPLVITTFVVFEPAAQDDIYTTVSINDFLYSEDRRSGKPKVDRKPRIFRLNESAEELTEEDCENGRRCDS